MNLTEKDPNAEVRRAAAVSLVFLKPDPDESVLPAFPDAVWDNFAEVRAAACRALMTVGARSPVVNAGLMAL